MVGEMSHLSLHLTRECLRNALACLGIPYGADILFFRPRHWKSSANHPAMAIVTPSVQVKKVDPSDSTDQTDWNAIFQPIPKHKLGCLPDFGGRRGRQHRQPEPRPSSFWKWDYELATNPSLKPSETRDSPPDPFQPARRIAYHKHS